VCVCVCVCGVGVYIGGGGLWQQQRISRVRTVFFWVITQRVVVIICWRFGTTYRSHFQSKMGPICYPEISVRNYNSSVHLGPEERSSHLLGSESLKSISRLLKIGGICLQTEKYQLLKSDNAPQKCLNVNDINRDSLTGMNVVQGHVLSLGLVLSFLQ